MSWVDQGGRRYYYKSSWVAGKVVSTYLGDGEAAWAESRRVEAARAAREDRRSATRRVRRLVRSLDELPLSAGWIKCRGEIRPRGRTTVRNLAGREDSFAEALERESARRRFARAEDLDSLIERYRVDVAGVHINELVARITSDPDRREATRLAILREAATLAGEGASELIVQVALAVVVLDCEYHFASIAHLRALESPRLAGHYLKWRETIDKRLNQKLKTLGIVRHLDATELRSRLSSLRLVS
jgi:hypothetical protein